MSNVIQVNPQFSAYYGIFPLEMGRGVDVLLILVRERVWKIPSLENQICIFRKGVPFHTYIMNRMFSRHIYFLNLSYHGLPSPLVVLKNHLRMAHGWMSPLILLFLVLVDFPGYKLQFGFQPPQFICRTWKDFIFLTHTCKVLNSNAVQPGDFKSACKARCYTH